jgi:hypothetical protein
VDTEVSVRSWGDESVLAIRVSHDAPGGDARHRVHVHVPVKTLSEESRVVVSKQLVHVSAVSSTQ